MSELKRAGVLAEEAELGTVDDLLSALEGTSGTTARLVDLPPLELAELRASLAELRASAAELPSPQELAALYAGLQLTAARERRSLLEVSSGIGLAFVLSARNVGREHLVTPYREDWNPLREEGFAAYSRRVSEPYRDAVSGHFDAEPNELDRPRARAPPSMSFFTRFLPRPSTVSRVKLGLATLAAFVALVAALPAHALDADAVVRHELLSRRPAARCHIGLRGPCRLCPGTERPRSVLRSSRRGSSATRPLSTPGGAARTRRARRASTSSLPRAVRAAFGALDISNIQLPRPVERVSVRLPGDPTAAVVRGRVQRGGEGLPRLLRRPDRPGRRRARLRAGCPRGRLRSARDRGRLPRLLRSGRGRLAPAGGRDPRARARLRSGRAARRRNSCQTPATSATSDSI